MSRTPQARPPQKIARNALETVAEIMDIRWSFLGHFLSNCSASPESGYPMVKFKKGYFRCERKCIRESSNRCNSNPNSPVGQPDCGARASLITCNAMNLLDRTNFQLPAPFNMHTWSQ